MKIFFDTEFTGLHKDTTLISIGCIDEDGKTFYAEFTDYDPRQCDDWIRENVIAHLAHGGRRDCVRVYHEFAEEGNFHTTVLGDKGFVAEKLAKWLSKYEDVQFVSDVCHYDMVLLIDLFGGAFDLPQGVSPVCHDINQDIARHCGMTDYEAFDASREGFIHPAIEGDKHNALYDAKVIRELYYMMNGSE